MSETEVTIFIMGAIWGATAFLILDTFRLQHEIDRLKKLLNGSAEGSHDSPGSAKTTDKISDFSR